MGSARTATNYIRDNMEVYGRPLEQYCEYLRMDGKSPSSIQGTSRYIRAFLARCPPTDTGLIDDTVMLQVEETIKTDGLKDLYIRESMIHFGRFMRFVFGRNSYSEIDPDSKERWFEGHMGRFLFQKDLDRHIESMRRSGYTEETMRRRSIHVTICCRILEHDMGSYDLGSIDEKYYEHISGMSSGLCQSLRTKILYDLDEFIKFSTGASICVLQHRSLETITPTPRNGKSS